MPRRSNWFGFLTSVVVVATAAGVASLIVDGDADDEDEDDEDEDEDEDDGFVVEVLDINGESLVDALRPTTLSLGDNAAVREASDCQVSKAWHSR
jgi:hypothetical protein